MKSRLNAVLSILLIAGMFIFFNTNTSHAAAIDLQFANGSVDCSGATPRYCVTLQIKADSPTRIGNSTVFFSYNANGITPSTPSYTAAGFDTNAGYGYDPQYGYLEQSSLGEINYNILLGNTSSSAPADPANDVLPTLSSDVVFTTWSDVAEFCFDVLDASQTANLQFSTTYTGFNDDNNDATAHSLGALTDSNDDLNCSAVTPDGVYIRTYLQGAFNDGASADGNMTAGLIGTNPLTGNPIIPLTQPYNVAPFNYTGTESIAAPFADMVDWILVEAATSQSTASVVERRAGILHTNGLITDVDGTSPLAFSTLTSGVEYFFIIRHRNHLPAATRIAFDIATTSAAAPHDMTTQQSLVAGAIPCLNDLGADGIGNENYPGLFGLILGNADGSGNVNLSDRSIWEAETGSFFNYNAGDFDMDRFVNVNDRIVWDLNTGAFVHPSIWP